jgi:uncharacterized protein YndB with AHSA1/START domain
MAHETTTIRQKIYIPAKPEEVYNALADPELHATFTETRVTGQTKVGHSFTALNGYVTGVYLELEEGKRIVQQWQTEKWPQGAEPSIVELVFEAKDDGTEVTLVQSPVSSEYAEALAKGWFDFYWTALQAYFEKKPPSP